MEKIKGLKKDNRGLSLVELICAIAVFSVLVTGICSSIIISTRVYAKSTTDVMMQQSAQVLTNFLTNLVVDAKDVTWDEENGKMTITDTNDNETYVLYDSTLGRLSIESDNGSGILSDNLTYFSVVNTFTENQSVNFSFTIEVSNVNFDSTFTATSRNGYVQQEGSAVILISDSVIVLEPNQDYYVDYSVTATTGVSNKIVGVGQKYPFDPFNNDANSSYYEISSTQIHIHIGSAELSGELNIEVETEYVDPLTGFPYDSKSLLVKVRRINNIGLSSSSPTGSGDKGELYTVSATFDTNSVSNGDKLAQEFEKGEYCSPYVVSMYDIKMVDKNGNSVANPSYYIGYEQSILTKDGTYSTYEEAKDHLTKESVYKFKLKILNEIEYGTRITITVRGDHSYGNNNSSDGTFNRCDKSYKDEAGSDVVYASTEIYIRYPQEPDNDFHRGEAYTNMLSYMGTSYPTTNYGGISDYFFARVRNKTTDSEWTSWIITGEQSNATGKMLEAESMRYFAPNDDYEFEYVRVVYNPVTHEVKYPNYYALFEAGSPFYGYTYIGGNDYETIYTCGCRWEMPAMKLDLYQVESSNINTINFKIDAVTAFWINNNLRYRCYPNGSSTIIKEDNCKDAQKVLYYPDDWTKSNKYYFTTRIELDNFNNNVNNYNNSNAVKLASGSTYNIVLGIIDYEIYDNLPTSLNQNQFIRSYELSYKKLLENGENFVPIENVTTTNGTNYGSFVY